MPRCWREEEATVYYVWITTRRSLQDAKATLVSFGAPGHAIAAPRRRRLIADRPRILARDERAAHLAAEPEPPR